MDLPALTGEEAIAFIVVVWPLVFVLIAAVVWLVFLHG